MLVEHKRNSTNQNAITRLLIEKLMSEIEYLQRAALEALLRKGHESCRELLNKQGESKKH